LLQSKEYERLRAGDAKYNYNSAKTEMAQQWGKMTDEEKKVRAACLYCALHVCAVFVCFSFFCPVPDAN
jgi:hypothetical protein